MQNDDVVVDSPADETQPTALDPVDRRSPITLLEQYLAGSKVASDAPSLKRRRQGIKGLHRRQRRLWLRCLRN
jgi:truncated hemoglobin YjbI